MPKWPLQSQCDKFYGDPRGKNGAVNVAWEAANIVSITIPYRMTYAGKPVKTIRVHKKCAEAFKAAFDAIWEAAGKKQAIVDAWGASIFGGSYNYRLMRNSNRLSMHSYGCAVDLDPSKHPMRANSPKFCPEVIKAFYDVGAINLPKDRMHFQFAIVD